jgi:hypothetical protein
MLCFYFDFIWDSRYCFFPANSRLRLSFSFAKYRNWDLLSLDSYLRLIFRYIATYKFISEAKVLQTATLVYLVIFSKLWLNRTYLSQMADHELFPPQLGENYASTFILLSVVPNGRCINLRSVDRIMIFVRSLNPLTLLVLSLPRNRGFIR